VPLAHQMAGVAEAGEVLGQERKVALQGEEAVVEERSVDAVPAGQERRPRGRALGLHIVSVDDHSLSRQGVNERGGDLAVAVEPEIIPAEVVSDEDDDVLGVRGLDLQGGRGSVRWSRCS
jgi:hypothetical protein